MIPRLHAFKTARSSQGHAVCRWSFLCVGGSMRKEQIAKQGDSILDSLPTLCRIQVDPVVVIGSLAAQREIHMSLVGDMSMISFLVTAPSTWDRDAANELD